MIRLRFLCGALIVSLLWAGGMVRADDQEQSAVDQLTKAVEAFKAGEYEESQRLLGGIDGDALADEEQQVLFQQYVALAREALDAVAAAKADLAKALDAVKAEERDKAQKLLAGIVASKYAPAALKAQAEAKLKEIAPPPAKRSGGSLLGELQSEHSLLWQQAVKTYLDNNGKIRIAIVDTDFAEAERLMDVARQTIELNRRYASSAAEYEDYRQQAQELERFIADQKREYNNDLIREKHEEIKKREEDRIERIKQNKKRQITQLMDQAGELRKEQRYDDAIEVLKQVLAIDPKHDRAAWMKETLEDLAVNQRDQEAVRDRHEQAQDLFVEADEAAIPWHKDIMYPKNWPEIVATRRGAEEEQESEANEQTRRKLNRRIPTEIKFEADPFEEVIDSLRDLTGLNFDVRWSALEASAIERDEEITLKVRDVTYAKVLEMMLDELGAGEFELAYEIDDGVITVSTKEDLSRKRLIKVYNVQDLLIEVPNFQGTPINVNQIGQGGGQQGGLGGGRFIRGGGGGGGGGGQGGQNLFGGAGGGGAQQGGDYGTDQGDDPMQPIIDLIQQTIDPESWREAGGSVGSIQALHQQLIVTQTATAHAQLRDLLKSLRKARALQIAVETRFITISRNWLEQIGVDLDIVLNNGNAGFDRTTILDPATNNPILVPRRFTRMGFTPLAPATGYNPGQQPFQLPYGQVGLVPAPGNIGPASGSMTRIPMVNNTLDLASPSDTNVAGSLGSLVNRSPAFQIFGSFLDNIQVDFLLRATQVDRRSSDLESPRLVLFNGQRAVFQSFIEQDYIAALTPVIGDNAGAFMPQVATALSGRQLDVQATVSADRRYVTMTVQTYTVVFGDFRSVFFGGSQTVGSGFIELVSRAVQQIQTTVSVPDGGTLLMGGLKLSGERDIDAGVPILSRIPILKRAFSNTSNVKDDQVLLILIKPTIIIQDEAEREAFPTLSAMTSP